MLHNVCDSNDEMLCHGTQYRTRYDNRDANLQIHSFGPQSRYGRSIQLLFQQRWYCTAPWPGMKAAVLTAHSIFSGAGFLIYSNYFYHTYIIGAFHKYPEPVAKQMRKALYYSNISLEPRNAIKYYREALRVADEVGMDPFSDEIMGIKIHLAGFMEKIQRYKQAIDILEIVKRDNLLWVDQLGNLPGNEGKRTRVLGKTVGVSVKLGELYANQYVSEQEAAEERLVWAVETVLKEQQRRQKDGVKDGEGEWLSPEEIGGSLEALGHHYEEKSQHYLAAPLFLQALALSPPTSCHTTVLSKFLLAAYLENCH